MNRAQPAIAHVLHRLHLAGAEILAAELARQLRGRFRFLFLCLDDRGPLGEQLATEGFEVLALERRPGWDWPLARRLRAVVRQHRIDLLHAHQYTPFFYAALSRGLKCAPPILFTEHGRHYPDARKLRRVWANRWLLRRHDRVTAVGRFIKQALIDNEGLAAERIEVIHNGIEPRRFAATPSARTRMRAELGVHQDQPLILQVARLHPVKDHPTALAAMALVLHRFPQALLLLVGDGPERANLESRAKELGIAGQVRWLGPRQDVPNLMSAADVFLLSSLSEGISVTLLEAMAASLPIAATEVGGNGEVVEPERTGLLSPRGDAAALAANLVRLLNDRELRLRLGRDGRERLLQHFTQDRMHRAYAAIYDQMLGLAPPTAA